MQKYFNEFIDVKNNGSNLTKNTFLNDIIGNLAFYMINDENKDHETINQMKNKTKIVIIDACKLSNVFFLIVHFDETVIIVKDSEFHLLKSYFDNNKDSNIYIINIKAAEIYSLNIDNINLPSSSNKNSIMKTNIHIEEVNSYFISEINQFCIHFSNQTKLYFWKLIQRSVFGYLIKKSYINHNIDRVLNNNMFFKEIEEKQIYKKDYIELENVGQGTSSLVRMIFLIETQQLYVMKIIFNDDLFNREHQNYFKIHHPFLVRYFGFTQKESKQCLIMEYIQGISLDSIKKNEYFNQ